MTYLYKTLDSNEKVKERADTLEAAKEKMENMQDEFGDNVTLEIKGWNSAEFTFTATMEDKAECDRIINTWKEGNTPFEYVKHGKKDGVYSVNLYFAY